MLLAVATPAVSIPIGRCGYQSDHLDAANMEQPFAFGIHLGVQSLVGCVVFFTRCFDFVHSFGCAVTDSGLQGDHATNLWSRPRPPAPRLIHVWQLISRLWRERQRVSVEFYCGDLGFGYGRAQPVEWLRVWLLL